MGIILEAFPKLSNDMLIKSGYIATEYSFSFYDNGVQRRLKSVPADSSTSKTAVLKLDDDGCKWHPEECGLVVEYNNTINTPVFFFGPKGLVAKNGGVLGIALVWTDQEANVRGVEHIGELSLKSPCPCEIKGSFSFPAKILRGTLIMQVALYLKNSGKPSKGELHLAQYPGTILGVLDETRVIIDGNGSLFPIHTVPNPTEPLWWVKCDWNDPTQDLFSDDNFCIYLNSAHKDYPSLNVNEGIKNSPLLAEIICSSLQLLVSKVLNDKVYSSATLLGNGLAPGSISSVINYFIRVFNWTYDSNNPEVLAMCIRKTFMTKI